MPTITIDGDATSYELTNLSPSTYYEVEVTAKNREGTSDPQGFIFVTSKGKSNVLFFNSYFNLSLGLG